LTSRPPARPPGTKGKPTALRQDSELQSFHDPRKRGLEVGEEVDAERRVDVSSPIPHRFWGGVCDI
jgi:hypothetical protein